MDKRNDQFTGGVNTPADNNSKTVSGKAVAAVAGAAIVGGAAGIAAAHYYADNKEESKEEVGVTSNQENMPNAEKELENNNENADASPASSTSNNSTNSPSSMVSTHNTFAQNRDENGMPDYTGTNNADPVVDNGGSTDVTDAQTGTSGTQATTSFDTDLDVVPLTSSVTSCSDDSDCSSGSCVLADDDSNDVQVLGVFDETDDEGNPVEMAVLYDGNELSVVLDADDDGVADYAYIDENGNEEIDEGEVYDISDRGIEMAEFGSSSDYQDSDDCSCGYNDSSCYDDCAMCEEDYLQSSSDDDYSSPSDYDNSADVYDA